MIRGSSEIEPIKCHRELNHRLLEPYSPSYQTSYVNSLIAHLLSSDPWGSKRGRSPDNPWDSLVVKERLQHAKLHREKERRPGSLQSLRGRSYRQARNEWPRQDQVALHPEGRAPRCLHDYSRCRRSFPEETQIPRHCSGRSEPTEPSLVFAKVRLQIRPGEDRASSAAPELSAI